MKKVIAMLVPQGAKVEIIDNWPIGGIMTYSPIQRPTYQELWVPTFESFNELTDQVVWC